MPLVSVIIPTFNRESTLERAINSVLTQTHSELEVIIVDDASTDQSKTIIEEFINSDPRVNAVFLSENGGVSRARNKGFEIVKGEWIALLDSDDEWLPKRLEKQLELSKEMPDCPLIHGEEIWIRNGKRVNQKKIHQKSGGRIFSRALHLCLISPSATIMKSELYRELGGFSEEFPVCEDYYLWLKVTCRYDIGFVKEPVINKYGGHEDQLSARYRAMDFWRVKAMDSTFAEDRDFLREDEQRELIQVLIKKCQILKQGYLKHQNLENLSYVESLLEKYLPYHLENK